MEEPPSFLIFSPLLTEQGLKTSVREGEIGKETLDSQPMGSSCVSSSRMSEKKLRHNDVSYFSRSKARK